MDLLIKCKIPSLNDISILISIITTTLKLHHIPRFALHIIGTSLFTSQPKIEATCNSDHDHDHESLFSTTIIAKYIDSIMLTTEINNTKFRISLCCGKSIFVLRF